MVICRRLWSKMKNCMALSVRLDPPTSARPSVKVRTSTLLIAPEESRNRIDPCISNTKRPFFLSVAIIATGAEFPGGAYIATSSAASPFDETGWVSISGFTINTSVLQDQTKHISDSKITGIQIRKACRQKFGKWGIKILAF